MTVAIVTTFADKMITFRSELVASMMARGHRLVILGCEPEETCRPILSPHGIPYARLPFMRTNTNPLREALFILKAARILKPLHVDVLLVYGVRLAGSISIAAKLAGIQRIYSMINGTGTLLQMGGMKGTLARLLSFPLIGLGLHFNGKVFFQNPDNRNIFVAKGLVKKRKAVVVNGSGVNLEKFIPAPLPDNKRFLFIGRMVRDKGVMEFLKAAEEVKKRYPEAEFIMIGPFDENLTALNRDVLETYLKNGVIEHITWYEHIQEYIASCFVFVLPSYHEGTPRTVVEAMAMGRPIITTDAPGCRETVRNGTNGFLVPVGNAALLADKIIWMIEHREEAEAMGHESLRICREKYDVHQVNQIMLSTMNL